MNKPILATVTLISGIALGGLTAYWFVNQKVQSISQDNTSAQQAQEQKPLFYRNHAEHGG